MTPRYYWSSMVNWTIGLIPQYLLRHSVATGVAYTVNSYHVHIPHKLTQIKHPVTRMQHPWGYALGAMKITIRYQYFEWCKLPENRFWRRGGKYQTLDTKFCVSRQHHNRQSIFPLELLLTREVAEPINPFLPPSFPTNFSSLQFR